MAGSPSRTLKLTYLGDASNLSKSTKKAGDDVTTLGDRVKGVGKALAVGFAAIGAAGIAMGKKLFDAFENVSTANARIEAVVKSMGNFEGQIGEVTDRLVKQAEATAKLTGVDRTLIKEAQALLLTFDSVNKTAGEAGGVFDRATQAAVDLSAAGFGSVTGTATQLAKALEDPIKGLASLGRSGVTFTEDQKELIKVLVESNRTFEAQDIILQAIEKQVGGVAEATATGSARIKQSFGILTEQIATALAPAFEDLVTFGLNFVEKVGKWWDNNGDRIIEKFGKFRDRVAETATKFKEFFQLVKDDLTERGTFARLREQAGRARDAMNEAGEATRTLGRAIGLDFEQSASLFSLYVDRYLLAPIEPLLKRLELLVDLYNKFADAVARTSDFFRGGGQLSLPGGDFRLPDVPTSSAAVTRTATGSVVINVNGQADPERFARDINRTLTNSTLRTGPVLTEYQDTFFAGLPA
jgi:hypothetical protein